MRVIALLPTSKSETDKTPGSKEHTYNVPHRESLLYSSIYGQHFEESMDGHQPDMIANPALGSLEQAK